MAKKGTKATKPAAPEVDEDAPDLEEAVEEDEVEEASAKGKGKGKKETAAAQEVTFGASDLAKYITEKTGKPVDARNLRTLIRRMARDGSGRIKREIVAGNRTRYDWSGPQDPEVKLIIKAFNAGELEQDKKEKLDALKAKKQAEKEAGGEKAGKGGKKSKGGKKASKPAAPVEDDDEELNLDDE